MENQFTIQTNNDVITVLSGQSDNRKSTAFIVFGDLFAPSNYAALHAKKFHQTYPSVLEVDRNNNKIVLRLNVGSDVESKIIGKINESQEWSLTRINQLPFTRKELRDLIRIHPYLLAEKDISYAKDLCDKLLNFSVNLEKSISAKDDRKGSIEHNLKIVARATGIPEQLKFNIPYFDSEKKLHEVICDVELEANSAGDVNIYLVSPMAILGMKETKEALFNEALAHLESSWQELGICVIGIS